MNPDLIKSYDTGAAVTARRIVKFDAADGVVIHGAAATDSLIGITGQLDAASGDRIDVTRTGIALVEYGGNVTRGDKLTSDANGKAVTAAPSTGANVQIIGIAEVSGVDGDIGQCLISPSTMQGA